MGFTFNEKTRQLSNKAMTNKLPAVLIFNLTFLLVHQYSIAIGYLILFLFVVTECWQSIN